MPTIHSILETVLYYTDEAATERFYSQVLQCRLLSRHPGRSLFYRAGSSVLLLFNAEATAQSGQLPPHGAAGPGHVCFLVSASEYTEWKRHLSLAGVAVLQEMEWGKESGSAFRPGRSFYFRDPAGNLLEIADADIWPE